MKKFQKILAPTDLSELSQAGVRYALELGKASGAKVTVYHAISTDEIMSLSSEIRDWSPTAYPFVLPRSLFERYEKALSRFLEEHFSDLAPLGEVEQKVELGSPHKNIVEEAKKQGVDLIVMSTHGRTGLSHMLSGSVTEEVLRHAPCPVLSIRPKIPASEAEKAA